MVETIEQTRGIQDLFQERLDGLKRKDYRKYRILAGELFEWGAAISSKLNGNGNLGDLVERQIICLSEDSRTEPKEIVNKMFDAYLKGNEYAFVSLFHHIPNNYALKRG